MLTIDNLILFLNSRPPEFVAGIELVSCVTALACFTRWFGKSGLYGFITTLLIVGNIQVLKGSQFSFLPQPIALGTMLFGIIALSFDIITEYYGKAAALKGVRLSFFILGFFTLLMFLTAGIKPLNPTVLTVDELPLYTNHEHIKALFVPLPQILIASLISYFISQYVDIILFHITKRITHRRWLWLRTIIATSISALVDTVLFSLLAWKWLNPNPVSWHTLLTVYILQTYPLRLLCSFCFSPLIYLARFCLPKEQHVTVS